MRYTLFCNNCGNDDFDVCAEGTYEYTYICTECRKRITLADTQDIVIKADVLVQDEDMPYEPCDYDVDELADDFPDIPIDEDDPDWDNDDDDGVMDGACDE